ncbi:MAG: Rieske 2Fe-2S domain-containing protein [Acidimicrobiales bacterium]|nr:Rieske 2Fe-2S domain-containing protein [Acidimicrobiales bacterium]
MRLTGTGHAGLRIDTSAGSILCDPWVNPAFFASWFPFPDNTDLDWARLGAVDYLYVSHLHGDHFDREHLRRSVATTATVLLPEFPTADLEDALRAVGFTRFCRTRTNEPVDLGGGLRIMIQALTSPTDGPIGDSSLWVEHDGVRLLNQNDARPTDLGVFAGLGHVHAHLLQFSGAIWYPMVYDMPPAKKAALGRQKRARQIDRTIRYIDDLKASWVFPVAGPPAFLDDELWRLNDLDGDPANIFLDQRAFLERYHGQGHANGVTLLPGSVADVTPDRCVVTQPVPDVEQFFEDKARHLAAYRERRRPVIEAERAAWHHPGIDVFEGLKQRVEPLLAASTHLACRMGQVLLDVEDDSGARAEHILIDGPSRQVRHHDGEDAAHQFTIRRTLVEHLLHTGEVDWVNSLFLSCRFSASRQGPYNEAVFVFFKCLSPERLRHAETWYAERETDTEDIVLDDWVVQRRCPHLNADLSRFAAVEGNVLTCQMHGWQFDLDTGRCLTSGDHEIRSRRHDRVTESSGPDHRGGSRPRAED